MPGAILQESVFEEPRPRNREQLIARIQTKWDSLDQNYLKALVESFPSRIQACVEAEGGPTKY